MEPGSDVPAGPEAFLGAPTLAKILRTVSKLVAKRAGEKWAADQAEALELAEALDPVLARYLPSPGEIDPLWGNLVVAIGAYAIPRLDLGGEDPDQDEPGPNVQQAAEGGLG